MTELTSSVLQLGNCTYHVEQKKLLDADGTELKLRPQSLAVLHLLVSKPNQVVSKDEIFESVWNDVVVSDDSLVQCVADIRRALGDKTHKILQTVPRRGYLLIIDQSAELSWGKSLSGFGLPAVFMWGASIGLVLIVTLFFTVQNGNSDVTHQAGLPAEQDDFSSTPAISIVPFTNLSNEDRWGRLAQGLSMDIANDLSRHHWLKVTSLNPSNVPVTPVETGRELKTRFVLDGTLQAENNELRISARLTDAAADEIIWSQRWNRPARNIFSVQDEILEKIDGVISGAWTGVIAKHGLVHAKRKSTDSLDAYELFLLGTEYKHKFTPESDEIAASYFEKAVEIDPGFSKAWITLAVLRANQSVSVAGKDKRNELMTKRRDATLKAYEADPADSDVLLQVSWLKSRQGDLNMARDSVQQAVDSAPNNPDILAHAAWVAAFRSPDLKRKGVLWGQKAVSLSSTYPPWYQAGLGIAAFYAEEFELSLSSLKNAPDMADVLIHRASAAALLGNTEEAAKAVARFKAIIPADFTVHEYAGLNSLHESSRSQLMKGAALAGLPIGGEP